MGTRNHRPNVSLEKSHWDCVVVGGGITGSGIIHELALRGLKCALFEKGDFASGTSSKTGKLVHGGLRYLKYFHFKTVYESCRERYHLYRILAPEVVTPVQFILPFYKNSKTPQWLAMIGLFLYDLISKNKKIGSFGRANELELATLGTRFKREGLRGALTYYDCFCFDFRLVLTVLKTAFRNGATVVNYMEVKQTTKNSDGKWRLALLDQITKQELEVTSDNVIFACGAWSEKVLSQTTLKNQIRLKGTMGIHILVPQKRLGLKHTIAVEHPLDARPMYMVPWGEMILIGTTDNYCDQELDNLHINKNQIDYLLKAVNYYFNDQHLSAKDIISAYIGVRPLIGSDEGIKEEKISRDYKIIATLDGLYAIVGGKLTTFRLMSETLVEKIFRERFPGHKFQKGQSLVKLADNLPNNENAIEEIIKTEWVEKLEDLIFRRTSLYLEKGKRIIPMLPDLAQQMATILGKSNDEISEDIRNAESKVMQVCKEFEASK